VTLRGRGCGQLFFGGRKEKAFGFEAGAGSIPGRDSG
jgi:hypothetical protein